MKTVLITGCSSGFGLTTARYFLDRDWNVVATMRTHNPDLLPASQQLRILPLDIARPTSIMQALTDAGDVDALVNNAGVGMLSATEASSLAQIEELFDTNTIGTIAMTKAFLPQFIARRSGVIVNISSSVTLKPLPLLAAYSASKAAVNAFTESLSLELEPLGVRLRLVLPGAAPTTNFGQNARAKMGSELPEAYAEVAKRMFDNFRETGLFTFAEDVAQAVWSAVTDPSSPLRIPAGADARSLTQQLQT